MSRRLLIALFVVPAAVGFAAPVPKETDADVLARLFGKPVDPDKDCEFALSDGTTLEVTVPGKFHAMYDDAARPNAPRTARPVTGDFVAEVRMAIAYTRDAGPADPEYPRVVGGGMLATAEADATEEEAFVVEARHLHEGLGNGPWRTSDEFDVRAYEHEAGTSTPRPLADGRTFVRLTRKAGEFYCDWSDDGRNWTQVSRTRNCPKLGATVLVGPYVIQNTDKPLTVTFDEFKIKPLAGE